MKREDAARLVKDTFSNQFEEDRYRLFAKNLFNDLDESKAFAYHGSYIPDAYKDHVRQYKRIGKYTDPEGAELDVLIVYLKKETSLERARTMQRNFIAHYLKNRGEKDAAIVAFCTDGLEDWRFSYVRMDYRTEQTESGKVKVKEELTPARRYSFLVGKNEPNHTAQQQLVPILENDKNNPSLAELEKAFNIESVTKEFFNKYKDLFLKVHEELDAIVAKDKKIKKEFEDKLVDTANFAKKLLGQIVFLYFIQKKGWLGVARDKAWGTGPRNFMRLLHEKAVVDYDNFFNDILEPLFYEALAIDRGEVSLYSRFKCKIPFLNGGLFEPVNGYNWEETDILLKNETFAEILGTFDLYNFTVREDEPLEREVAVDPEMLGKVFENLLEVKDRKSKGAYYTPREIVHYMCQQSLISYLDSALNSEGIGYERMTSSQSVLFGQDELPPADDQLELMSKVGSPAIPRNDIELFVRQGDFGIQNDLTVEEKGRETKAYVYKLPEAIRLNAGRIDKTLADIKICDPAIGSGAFPVGMLHEIVKARETLTVYLDSEAERTAYNFKRHAIQESIYGVDIDPGAVDIAKLRLWLSLVVDEDDFRAIKPLPNLDYKIVCGNSLSNVNIMFHHVQLKELEVLKSKYFEETNPRKKIKFKEDISKLIGEITNDDKHFDFNVYFSEVFDRKGGFDITIGNPPYVRADAGEKHLALRKEIIASKQFETLWEKWDLYVPFIERGYKLLRSGGITTMIVSDAYCHAKYAQKSQNWFLQNSRILRLDFLSKIKVFDAGVHNIVYFFQRDDGGSKKPERRVHEDEFGNLVYLPSDTQHKLNQRAFFPEETKNDLKGIPLEGICYITYGLRPSSDENDAKGEFVTADLVSAKRDSIHCKPYVEGKHLANWYRVNHLWLEWGTARAPARFCRPTFPDLYTVEEKLLAQRSPGPDPVVSYDDEKLAFTPASVGFVLWRDLAGVRNNSLKKVARYRGEKPPRPDLPKREELEKTSRQFDIKYLLGAMNSSVAREFLRANRRSNIHLYPDDWKKLPIPDVTPAQQKPIVKLVDKIIEAKKADKFSDVSALEAEIDKLACELYSLTPEAIAIVEGKG